jgi:limonene-1,2-epoxide hydrolase
MSLPDDAAPTPLTIVNRFFEAMAAQDLEAGTRLLHEDIVYQNVPFPADRGKDAVVRRLKSFEPLVTKFEVRMVNIAANGPIVLTERVDVLSGPWVYLDIWVCGTFEVRDGRIILWRDYFDLAEATAKLAVGPVRRLLGLTR